MTVKEAHTRVISALTQYDVRLCAGERKRGRENIYRMAHLFEAADKAREGAATLADYCAGLRREFCQCPPIDRFLSTVGA